jgi:heme/copper-type cytochrome/quinol oxidase subunit 1
MSVRSTLATALRDPSHVARACAGAVVTVDHKRLGIMYVVCGLVFFVIAGLEA